MAGACHERVCCFCAISQFYLFESKFEFLNVIKGHPCLFRSLLTGTINLIPLSRVLSNHIFAQYPEDLHQYISENVVDCWEKICLTVLLDAETEGDLRLDILEKLVGRMDRDNAPYIETPFTVDYVSILVSEYIQQ